MKPVRPPNTDNYKKNHGVPGVVYILKNPGLRAGLIKIGCSRRSGAARADDLNRDANTGTPGTFQCVFECRTLDCGRAEERVHKIYHAARRGKWGQEFFEVDLEDAKAKITQVCGSVDEAARKDKNIEKGASALTKNKNKPGQPGIEVPAIVIENPGNPDLLRKLAVNKRSSFFPVAFVLGTIFVVANLFMRESTPLPGPRSAQPPVEASTSKENVNPWPSDTRPISLGMGAESQGDARNEADSAKLLRRAAEQGNVYAQYKLGVMCAEGQGVPQDVEVGVKWFRMAAEQGHAEAQLNIGLAYLQGEGVPQDDTEAVKWLRLAADQGNTDAETKLDTMYTELSEAQLP